MSSEDRFGFEWGRYAGIDPHYEIQFRNWMGPLAPKDFRNKKILDAGCGMGRNSFWSLRWGARELVAFDHDQRTVQAAQKNLSGFRNVTVLFRNIYDIEWQDEFDMALCIGVLHHLENPKQVIRNLVRSLKTGGILVAWVYSYEGNEWIPRYVDPLRRHITSRLPVHLVHGLSYVFSIPLWLFVKIFRGPSPYLKQLSAFRLWHIQSIVFDQLIPTIAHYWKQEEVRMLFEGCGLREVQIFRPGNKSGWTVIGRR